MSRSHFESLRAPAARFVRSGWCRTGGALASGAAIGVAVLVLLGSQVESPPAAYAGPKPTATVSGAASKDDNYKYFQKVGPLYQKMQGSLKQINDGVNAQDWSLVQVGCDNLQASGQGFQDMLPSPDSRITPRIQKTADQIQAASDMCMGWGPGAPADMAGMMAHINDGLYNLKGAQLATGLFFG